MKKLLSLLALILSVVVVVACGEVTTGTGDTTPPGFMGTMGGKLREGSHLAGETFNFSEGISAIDKEDGNDVTIKFDLGTYNSEVAGEYEVTYTAEDKSGNKTNITRTIKVLESLNLDLDVIMIGENWIEYTENDTTAFELTSSGAKFRFIDKLHVMTKEVFAAEIEEHKASYTANAGLPVFPYGSVVITDKDYNIVQVRMQTGVYMQLDVVDGITNLTYSNAEYRLPWDNGSGGNMFFGALEAIPEGGYIFFGSSQEPQKTRIFINKNLFFSGYKGGPMGKDDRDVLEIADIEIKFVEDYKILMAKPAPIASPEIVLNRHQMSWTAIPNALNYEVFVNGNSVASTTGLTVDLTTLLAAETFAFDTEYQISVVAITNDVMKYSSSLKSNEITYKKIVIQEMKTPVVAVNGQVLTWEAVEGAASYEVYIKLGTTLIKVADTETTTFDATATGLKHNGYNPYIVKAIGLATHKDSANSDAAYVNQVVTKNVMMGSTEVKVMFIDAETYFLKRNALHANENHVYFVTGVASYKGAMTESQSVVAVLDSQLKVKLVRAVFAKQEYTAANEWAESATYANNTAQLTGLTFVEGDILVVGKNAVKGTIVVEGLDVVKQARDIVAYALVKEWAKFPETTANAADGGWRAPMTEFMSSKDVVISIK